MQTRAIVFVGLGVPTRCATRARDSGFNSGSFLALVVQALVF